MYSVFPTSIPRSGIGIVGGHSDEAPHVRHTEDTYAISVVSELRSGKRGSCDCVAGLSVCGILCRPGP